jgi:hypothetical protein
MQMKARRLGFTAGALLGLWLWQHAACGAVDTSVTNPETSSVIAITDVTSADGAVNGTLVNKSPRVLQDVKLLIRHGWIWKNERHPGDDSPGRADYYVVAGPIAPGGSVPFKYVISPPLPQRSDGHFKSSVEVVGFTEVGE